MRLSYIVVSAQLHFRRLLIAHDEYTCMQFFLFNSFTQRYRRFATDLSKACTGHILCFTYSSFIYLFVGCSTI